MAIYKTFQVLLDLKRPVSSRDIEVVEGDNGNILNVILTDDGEAVDLSGCRVLAIFGKPDGQTAQQDNDGNGVTIGGDDNNIVTIELYSDSFSPGIVSCELQIFEGTVLVTTAKFNFECRRSIFNKDTVQSVNEYPILISLIEEVKVIRDQEAGFILAEEIRVAAENERRAAETERITAEEGREESEAVRVAAEAQRNAAEAERVTAESQRDASEQQRKTAESSRAAAENERQAAETQRTNAEKKRISAETDRVSAEDAREQSEDARVELAKKWENPSFIAEVLPAGSQPVSRAELTKDGIRLYAGIPNIEVNGVASVNGIEPDLSGNVTISRTFIVTLEAIGWSSSAPYTQTVTVDGMLVTDNPIADVILSDDVEIAQAELQAWGNISQIATADGSITALCFKSSPAIDLNIQLQAVRGNG